MPQQQMRPGFRTVESILNEDNESTIMHSDKYRPTYLFKESTNTVPSYVDTTSSMYTIPVDNRFCLEKLLSIRVHLESDQLILLWATIHLVSEN